MRRKHTIGHKFVQFRMVFNIKIEDFRCKAWVVAGGHMTKAPAAISYVSVVSRESVRIAMFASHDVELNLGDMLNMYTASVTRNV